MVEWQQAWVPQKRNFTFLKADFEVFLSIKHFFHWIRKNVLNVKVSLLWKRLFFCFLSTRNNSISKTIIYNFIWTGILTLMSFWKGKENYIVHIIFDAKIFLNSVPLHWILHKLYYQAILCMWKYVSMCRIHSFHLLSRCDAGTLLSPNDLTTRSPAQSPIKGQDGLGACSSSNK